MTQQPITSSPLLWMRAAIFCSSFSLLVVKGSASQAITITGFHLKNDEAGNDKGYSDLHALERSSSSTSSSPWNNIMKGIEAYDQHALAAAASSEEEEDSKDMGVLDDLSEEDHEFLLSDWTALTEMSFPSASPSGETNDDDSFLPTNAPTLIQRTLSPAPSGPTTSPRPTRVTESPQTSSVPTLSPNNSISKTPSPSITGPPAQLPSVTTRAPSGFPSATTTAPQPSNNPPTRAPQLGPTRTSAPNLGPSANPSPSTAPTKSLSPDSSFVQAVFVCTERGVELATPPFPNTTEISIRVGYLAESLFFASDYIDELQNKILETSVASALECNERGSLFDDRENGSFPEVPIVTIFTGEECTSRISICTTLETQFEFLVVNDPEDDNVLDPETAAFLSYVALQENMDGGVFASEIAEVDRVQYLSPLPLNDPLFPDPIGAGDNDISVSPYTLGAVVAMSIGGAVALWAWSRNRRTRNNRHIALIENSSMDYPSQAYS